MKNKIVWGVLVLLAILLVVSVAFNFKLNEELKDKKCLDTKSNIEVISIADSIIEKDIIGTLNSRNNTDVYSLLFGGEEKVTVSDFSSDLKLYFILKEYFKNNTSLPVALCGVGEGFTVIPKNELNFFFEDNSYLKNLSNETITVGGYEVKNDGDNVKACVLSYGKEAIPKEFVNLEPVAAYKEDGYLYLDLKFLYSVLDTSKNETDRYYFNMYSVYDKTSKVIDSFEDENEFPTYAPDLNKYNTFTFKFKIANDKYYFEEMNKKVN